MRRAGYIATLTALVSLPHARTALGDPPTPPVTGDPAHGRIVYQGCMGCHSLDEDDVGPRHRGVVGRRAASVAGYAYSPALRASGLVWDCATLDRWLAGPQALVPGARMFYSLASAVDRADVIAYLAEESPAATH